MYDDGDRSKMDEKEKPALSHTVSLPSPSTARDGIASIANKAESPAKSVGNKQDAVTALPPGPPPMVGRGAPKAGQFRSKSVRTKPTSNKVWSFGDMAKAVGCGVTAFGSNVASTSRAVGSGVYHGSVAVGTNVVEGTKVAGRMTKDVTMAAGKGVVHAGDVVGTAVVDTGKQMTNATVNAVQDTTKFIESELGTAVGVGGPGAGSNSVPHVVTPGEDIVKIANMYNVPVKNIIMANKLNSRYLSKGREICIPRTASTSSSSAEGLDLLLTHPMETLNINCSLLDEDNKTRDVSVTFETEHVYLTSSDCVWRIEVELLDSISIERAHMDDEKVPALLPASEAIGAAAHSPHEVFDPEEEHANVLVTLKYTGDEGQDQETKLRVSSNVMFQIASHVDLWYPEKLDPDSSAMLSDPTHEEVTGKNRRRTSSSGFRSDILDKKAVNAMHLALPSNIKSAKWNLIYSTALDGYSLQYFYRKVTAAEAAGEQLPPVFLVIEDSDGDVFGAFLTTTPRITEEFAGTGESWLFNLEGRDQPDQQKTATKYEWSKANDYFFQGKANCLVMGASDGKFGVYVDGNLHHGRIDECETFVGWPKAVKDFTVKNFECFSFYEDNN